MENMNKGLTVPKWVQIVWPKIPRMPQKLSAQFVCPSPKVLDFNEKMLHWVSLLRENGNLGTKNRGESKHASNLNPCGVTFKSSFVAFQNLLSLSFGVSYFEISNLLIATSNSLYPHYSNISRKLWQYPIIVALLNVAPNCFIWHLSFSRVKIYNINPSWHDG